MSKWTLFSNHGHVLLLVARKPEARLRDVAVNVGITERAVQKIIRDLQDGGMLSITKHGRRNRYQVHTRKSLRHELESHVTVGQLVRLIEGEAHAPSPHAESPGDIVGEIVATGIMPTLSETARVTVTETSERATPLGDAGKTAGSGDGPEPGPASEEDFQGEPDPRPTEDPGSDEPEDPGSQGSLF